MAAKPIVAGTDGSEESLRAVDWAAREATLRGAPLRIVSAATLPPRMVPRAGSAEYDTVTDVLVKDRDRALAAAAERAAKMAPGLLIDTDQLTGQPAEAVTESGAGALMLVVGSRGAGAFTAMLLGSVSRYVASHASCPVVVVRDETAATRGQVGVGIAGLDHCADSLTFAFEEASLRKASLLAIHAWRPPQTDISRAGDEFTAADAHALEAEAARQLDGTAERVAGEVPGRAGQPGCRARSSGPGAGRPVRPRRPGGHRQARPAHRAARPRLGQARPPEPRARSGRRRPLLLTGRWLALVTRDRRPGGAVTIPAPSGGYGRTFTG